MKAVLFDMDGVLLKSEEAWFRTLELAGETFRGHPVTREEFAPTFGQGTEADARTFKLNISPDELNRFYVEHFPRFAAESTWVNPEAAETLRTLRARGLRTGLVTNSVTPIARALLAPPGLLELLDALACSDEAASKPAPDLVLLACRKLSVSPGETWFVGDSRFDEGAATAAGSHFVAYGWGNARRVDSLSALLALV